MFLDLPPENESTVNVRFEVKKGERMVRKDYTLEQIMVKGKMVGDEVLKLQLYP